MIGLKKTYAVPGTGRRYTGAKIAVGAALVGGAFIGYSILKKKKELERIATNFTTEDEAVLGLGMALGVAYEWWNPRRYVENEEEAVRILENVPHVDMVAEITKRYYKKYKRSLPRDLQKNLDAEQWARVRYMFVPSPYKAQALPPGKTSKDLKDGLFDGPINIDHLQRGLRPYN